MKPRDYCCCAIPTITTGIYTVLLEQFVLGIVVATLAVAAPAIVGSDSFTPWVLAIICYIAAGLQVLGFIGVAKERGILFRRYLTLHIFTTLAAFVVAGVMIGLSAGHHDDAQNSCIAKFFTAQSTSASLADTLCDIFPWVDVGVMGGLWLLLAISQIYFYTVVSGYSAYANDATGKYAPVADIPMRTANGSTESLTDHHGHARNVSVTEPDPAYPQQPYSDNPSFPSGAHTQPGAPTPYANQFNDPGYQDSLYQDSVLHRPEQYQSHPAEGSFRRKTPRLQKPAPYDASAYPI
ncbi:unnamed protein product [Peniophora sp. CBMAI 1063]|nr:unnamed protein product [Peniophora sp. CBMAI 1063]